MQLNVFEAKNRLSELIKAAQAGEEVVIANRGEPVARLVATSVNPSAGFVPGSSEAILGWLNDNPLPAYLQRTAADIDLQITQERSAWD